MKIVSTIARYLMGLLFTVAGLNGFLHFLKMPPKPGLAGHFGEVLGASHFMDAVFVVQVVSGVLFILGVYVPLALTLIGPVIVSILLFHILMDPTGIGPGILTALCWLAVFYNARSAFAGIFQAKTR